MQNIRDVPFEQFPSYIAAIHRIKPDRRYLYAVADIFRITQGVSDQPVSLEFDEGVWKVSLGRRNVGDIPEYASFSEVWNSLTRTASRQNAPWKKGSLDPPQAQIENVEDAFRQLSLQDTITGLQHLDQLWGASPGNEKLLRLGVKGLSLLLLQVEDNLELMDPVAGHALALLALMRDPPLEEKAFLAYLLGYEAEAMKIAESLPEKNLVHILTSRDPKQRKKTGRENPDPLHRFLACHQSGPDSDCRWFSECPEWEQRHDYTALRFGLRTGRLDGWEAGSLEAISLFQTVRSSGFPKERPSPSEPEAVEAQLSKFEKSLSEKAGQYRGPILDATSVESVYKAGFYGAIYRKARWLFDQLGSTPAAAELAETIVNPPDGTATELSRWMQSKVLFLLGDPGGMDAIAKVVSESTQIGTWPLSEISFLMANVAKYDDPRPRRVAQALLARFDSRPSTLEHLASILQDELLDVPRADRIRRAALVTAPYRAAYSACSLAHRGKDLSALRRIAEDPRHIPSERVMALRSLADLKGTAPQELIRSVETISQEDSGSCSAILYLVELLEAQHDLFGIENSIQAWMLSRGNRFDLEAAEVTARMAGAFRREGKLEQARSIIEPAARTWKASALGEKTRILADLGLLGEAADLARATYERYPEGYGACLMAEVLWQQGEYELAAKVLTQTGQRMDLWTYESLLPTSIERAFCKESPEKLERALVLPALDVSKIAATARQLEKHGHIDLAVALLEAANAADSYHQAPRFWAYQVVERSRGRKAALAWLTASRLPPRATLAQGIYMAEEYDLLWDLIDETKIGDRAVMLNVLKAAALVRTHSSRTDELSRLEQFFERMQSTEKHKDKAGMSTYGLYLMGKLSAGKALKLSGKSEFKTPLEGRLATMAWATAIRAEGERNEASASDWYQACVQCGDVKSPAYSMSAQWLLDRRIAAPDQSR